MRDYAYQYNRPDNTSYFQMTKKWTKYSSNISKKKKQCFNVILKN